MPVRNGELPAGGAEAAAEAGHVAVFVEWAGPAATAAAVSPLVSDHDVVILPASADGRDMAPRLAWLLQRPLLAGAIQVYNDRADISRFGGQVIDSVCPGQAFIVTLQPGVRGAVPQPVIESIVSCSASANDAVIIEVLPPDAGTIDLAEAPRILAGGAGLDSAERFGQLARLATRLAASVGATRVITDRGWINHERQIGTTGVVVDPDLYLAFGISGAVQHTSGLGNPEHIISVNTDPHCPMMHLADVAIVADANAVLDELSGRLGS